MAGTVILAADAYRMVDALKDYADALDAEGQDNYDLVSDYLAAAQRIEMTERVGNGLIFVRNFDLHMAQTAAIMLAAQAYGAAEAARAEAERLTAEGKRYEGLLSILISA